MKSNSPLLKRKPSPFLLSALLLAGFWLTGFAATSVKDGTLIYTLNGNEATVTGLVKDTVVDLVIPDAISYQNTTYRVTAISESGLSHKTFKTVTLGKNVAAVNKNAFYGCSKLTKVVFGEGMRAVGVQGFYNCSSLTDVVFNPDLESLDNYCFSGSKIASVVLPKGLQSFTARVFNGSAYLKSISVDPASQYFTSKDGVLFTKDMTTLVVYLAGKTDTIYTVPDGVKKLGDMAFARATNLKAINFDNQLESVGYRTFLNCRFTSLHFPAAFKQFGEASFYNVYKVNKITIDPANPYIQMLGEYLVQKSNMKAVLHVGPLAETMTIPEGIKILGETVLLRGTKASRGTDIKVVNLPNSMVELQEFAIGLCDSLVTVNATPNLKIVGEAALYEDGNLRNFNNASGVELVDVMAFQSCFKLDMPMPKALKKVELQGFFECGLKEAILPEGLTSLGQNAFMDCDSMRFVSIPSTVVSWSQDAFNSCDSLKYVKFAEGLKTIGRQAFLYCKKLEKIDLPESLVEIQSSAFDYCPIKEIKLPAGIRILGSGCFGDAAITSIYLPDGLQVLDNFVFSGCRKLKTVTGGKNIKGIGQACFANNVELESIELGKKVQSIGPLTFKNTPKLKKIKLPATLRSIGSRAFQMTGLDTIECRGTTPATVESDAFSNMSDEALYGTCKLLVPASAIETYKNAAVWKNFTITAGVEGVATEADATVIEIYNLQGIRLAEPVPGQVNILRLSDGSVRKVIPTR